MIRLKVDTNNLFGSEKKKIKTKDIKSIFTPKMLYIKLRRNKGTLIHKEKRLFWPTVQISIL